jgi:hypothetical protein
MILKGKDMKQFLRYILTVFDEPFKLILFLWVLVLTAGFFWSQNMDSFQEGPLKECINSVISIAFFSLMGALGIVFIVEKEAPIMIIPITGTPAILIGGFLVLGSFGMIIRVVIIRLPIWAAMLR